MVPRTPPELWGDAASAPVPAPHVSGRDATPAPQKRQDRSSIPPMDAAKRTDDGFADPPPAKGGFGKVIGAIFVFLFLGAVAPTAVYFVFLRGPSTPEVLVPATDPVTANVATTAEKLPAGTADQDFSANAGGKGGLILVAPGATKVSINSNSTGFKADWDGSYNYRLRDLDPGVLITKVTLGAGGAPVRTDVKVEAEKTCVYTFKVDAWEKSECR